MKWRQDSEANAGVLCYQCGACPDLLHKGHTRRPTDRHMRGVVASRGCGERLAPSTRVRDLYLYRAPAFFQMSVRSQRVLVRPGDRASVGAEVCRKFDSQTDDPVSSRQ